MHCLTVRWSWSWTRARRCWKTAARMGVRDILNGDYLSGSIRLLDALLIAGSIAGGVVLGWIMARGLGVA